MATVQDAKLTTTSVTVNPALGENFTGIVATFQSSNSYSTASDFGATIDWGDGDSSSGMISPNNTGGFNIVGQKPNPYDSAKQFTINVTIQSNPPTSVNLGSAVDGQCNGITHHSLPDPGDGEGEPAIDRCPGRDVPRP